MPIAEKYKAPFTAGSNYHVTFRSIDGLPLFRSLDERLFLLHQYSTYFQPVSHCLAYNLLDNHCHFIVQIKNEQELLNSITSIPPVLRTRPMQEFVKNCKNSTLVTSVIERQVNSFMASYAKASNKFHERKGGLFQSPFRRLVITNDIQLQQAIIYTHANAQKHGIVSDFKQHPYTSYHEILKGNSPYVHVELVLDFFGGKENFVQVHDMQAAHFYAV